jgi:lipase
MVLNAHRWGPERSDAVVCLHGLAQHARIFAELGRRLAERGHSVLALDLRGHGDSGREPPWDVETHLGDVLATLEQLGIERQTWLGHSFGGRVAAAAAARSEGTTDRVVLLDPGLYVPPDRALKAAEIDRLDWSFASLEGAANVLLSGPSIVATPREVVEAYVRDDVRKGPDGRFRFSFCPSAAVVAWSEMSRPAPPIAMVPTLVVKATVPLIYSEGQETRYRSELGERLEVVTVPNGHNVFWESPRETIAAIEGFIERVPCADDAATR